MACTRTALASIGGFAALGDYLADDYQLGWQIHQAGFAVKLLPHVVETVDPSLGFRDYLAHQLRWTRTYRVCRPLGYFAYGITHTFTFSLALWLMSGLGPLGPGPGRRDPGPAPRPGLVFRSCVPQRQARPPGLSPGTREGYALLALWLMSFLGSEVVWKGRRFRLTREGRLVPLK